MLPLADLTALKFIQPYIYMQKGPVGMHKPRLRLSANTS